MLRVYIAAKGLGVQAKAPVVTRLTPLHSSQPPRFWQDILCQIKNHWCMQGTPWKQNPKWSVNWGFLYSAGHGDLFLLTNQSQQQSPPGVSLRPAIRLISLSVINKECGHTALRLRRSTITDHH